jgi:hypothetical protein
MSLREDGDEFYSRLDHDKPPFPQTSFDLWARDHWREISAALKASPSEAVQRFEEIGYIGSDGNGSILPNKSFKVGTKLYRRTDTEERK